MSIKSAATYTDQTFKDLDFTEARFTDSEFYGCSFEDCNFNKTLFSHCIFEQCEFKRCDFSMVKPNNSHFTDCKFSKSKLLGIDWTLLNVKLGLVLEMQDCDLSYGNFVEVNINESKFINCKLHEIDFSNASLEEVDFAGSDLAKSRFDYTNLQKANFSEAYNYVFNPYTNKCTGAIFSLPEVLQLLHPAGIVIKNID